jgi:hypothetical protein
MGLYFYLHVVRRVPDPNKDNFFITEAPHNNGVHSSYMDLLFDQTVQIDPALSPKPDWYRNAFACTGEQFSQDNFFEPADVIRDLEYILAEIMHRNPQLPVHYWLRTGNKAGITEAVVMGSVDIYYGKEPCSVTSDWHGVYIWGPKGKVRDITGVNRFDCRLRKKMVGAISAEVNPQHDDGMDGTIYVERATFFDAPVSIRSVQAVRLGFRTPAPGFPNADLTLVRD